MCVCTLLRTSETVTPLNLMHAVVTRCSRDREKSRPPAGPAHGLRLGWVVALGCCAPARTVYCMVAPTLAPAHVATAVLSLLRLLRRRLPRGLLRLRPCRRRLHRWLAPPAIPMLLMTSTISPALARPLRTGRPLLPPCRHQDNSSTTQNRIGCN